MTTDTFEWLEDDSEAALRWQDEQDAKTSEVLARSPKLVELRVLLDRLATRSTSAPWHCGDHWFSVRDPGPKLMAEARDGTSVVLFDPATNPDRSLRDFWPSPDGRYVVAALLHGASEAGDLTLIDTSAGERVGDPALLTTWTRVEWLPDSSGVCFNGIVFDDDGMRGAIYEWTPGSEPVLQPVTSPDLGIYAKPSSDGRRVLVSAGNHTLRPIAVLDRESGSCASITIDETVHLDGAIIGDRLVGITNVGADRGRVVSVGLGAIEDTSTWTEVFAESTVSLRALSLVGSQLVVSELADGCGQLRVFDLESSVETIVAVPIRGALATSVSAAPINGLPMCRVSGCHNEVTFLASGPAASPRAYAYDLASKEVRYLGDDATAN